MPVTTTPRKNRAEMLIGGAQIISVSMDKITLAAARKLAFGRQIPFSMWMREAAQAKLKRDGAGK